MEEVLNLERIKLRAEVWEDVIQDYGRGICPVWCRGNTVLTKEGLACADLLVSPEICSANKITMNREDIVIISIFQCVDIVHYISLLIRKFGFGDIPDWYTD